MKDWLIEKTVPAAVNERWLKPYGTLTDFRFDSRNRSIEAELELKGETKPVRIRIGSYELLTREERTFIVIHEVTTTREWLTRAAQDFVVGREFELPQSVAKYIGFIA